MSHDIVALSLRNLTAVMKQRKVSGRNRALTHAQRLPSLRINRNLNHSTEMVSNQKSTSTQDSSGEQNVEAQ